jgi:tetratricopeptide (TPR) repeat protein
MQQIGAEINPEAVQSTEEKRSANDVISELRNGIQLTPDDATLHEKLGDALLDQGDADGAANEFKEAIRLSRDDDARLHKSLGSALEKAGKIQEAVQEYEHAVRLEPDEGVWQWYLSDALMKQGDTDGAIKGYQRAILLGCDDAWVHDSLGDALKAKGDLDAAIAEYTKAAELLPDKEQFGIGLAGALVEKGDLLVKRGMWKDALAEYHRAEELEHGCLGLSEELEKHFSELANEGRFIEAISDCREVLGIDPENADVRVLLGNLLARNGKYEEAFAECPRRFKGASLLPV